MSAKSREGADVGAVLQEHGALSGRGTRFGRGTQKGRKKRATPPLRPSFFAPGRGVPGLTRLRAYSGTFLPSLYVYKVTAGFFSSPLGSKAIWAVTPLKLVSISLGM
jgi:hypothetical protein